MNFCFWSLNIIGFSCWCTKAESWSLVFVTEWLIHIASWTRVNKIICSKEMLFSNVISHFGTAEFFIVSLNHIVIMTWTRLMGTWIIIRSNWNWDVFFNVLKLYSWVIVTGTCSRSTFLWVNWWSQTKLILWFFNYFRWNLIFKGTWMFYILWGFVSIDSINRPKLFWMFFSCIHIICVMSSRPGNGCYYFRIYEFGPYMVLSLDS